MTSISPKAQARGINTSLSAQNVPRHADTIAEERNHTQADFDGQFVYFIAEEMKHNLVKDIILSEAISSGIVYVKTNYAADQLAEQLNRAGIATEAIHGNKSNRTSEMSISNFCRSTTRILVITESASTAMQTAEVSVIINYDLPVSAETYSKRIKKHRTINRTVKAVSLCTEIERSNLKNINRILSREIEVIHHLL